MSYNVFFGFGTECAPAHMCLGKYEQRFSIETGKNTALQELLICVTWGNPMQMLFCGKNGNVIS
jgi:hypothetical protein